VPWLLKTCATKKQVVVPQVTVTPDDIVMFWAMSTFVLITVLVEKVTEVGAL
jgi:hypothetical protein